MDREYCCFCKNTRIVLGDCDPRSEDGNEIKGFSLAGFQTRFNSLLKSIEDTDSKLVKYTCKGCKCNVGSYDQEKKMYCINTKEMIPEDTFDNSNLSNTFKLVIPKEVDDACVLDDHFYDNRNDFREIKSFVDKEIMQKETEMNERISKFVKEEKAKLDQYKKSIRKERNNLLVHLQTNYGEVLENEKEEIKEEEEEIQQWKRRIPKSARYPTDDDQFFFKDDEFLNEEEQDDFGSDEEDDDDMIVSNHNLTVSTRGKKSKQTIPSPLVGTRARRIPRKDNDKSMRGDDFSKLATSLPIQINKRKMKSDDRYIFEENFSFIDSYKDFKQEFFRSMKEKNAQRNATMNSQEITLEL